MLTTQALAGLKLLLHLARNGPTAASALTTATALPRAMAAAVLTALTQAGFIQAPTIRGGAYALARPAWDIRIGFVLRVLDGCPAPLPCVRRTEVAACPGCADLAACPLRRALLQARDAMNDVFDTMSLAQLGGIPTPEAEAPMYYI